MEALCRSFYHNRVIIPNMEEPLLRGVTATINPLWIVLGLALVYTVFLTTLSIVQHQGLKTQMNDLGNADQALWGAASGDLANGHGLRIPLRSSHGTNSNRPAKSAGRILNDMLLQACPERSGLVRFQEAPIILPFLP